MDRSLAVNLTDQQSRSVSRASQCNNLAKHLESTVTNAVAYAASSDLGTVAGQRDTTNADSVSLARGLALVATTRVAVADLSQWKHFESLTFSVGAEQ